MQRWHLAGHEGGEPQPTPDTNAITAVILECGVPAFTSSALTVSAKSPSARPGNQEVADCVCAGLDILGLVCVGVFTSLCAVTELVVSVA